MPASLSLTSKEKKNATAATVSLNRQSPLGSHSIQEDVVPLPTPIEKSNGNFAVGQALARHKSGKTTLDVYKKAITPDAFKAGMKMLEAAGSKAGE